MHTRPLLVFSLSLLLAASAGAQQLAKRLSNQDVIDMTGLGLSDDVIIAKIRSAASENHLGLDTGVDSLKALKAAKVSDAVIQVMINPAPPAPAVVAVSGAPAAAADPNLPPPEVGVYWKDGTSFLPIEGQALAHTKTGGKAANFFSQGMSGEHWDAVLDGTTSRNRVKDRRPLFYFYVPDGSSGSDFTLIRLNVKDDRREFQIGKFGGMGGGKAALKKDKEVAFKAEHVAIRTYRVTLEADLDPGEYGFILGTGQQLGGGAKTTTSGGSITGRVYDFSVPR